MAPTFSLPEILLMYLDDQIQILFFAYLCGSCQPGKEKKWWGDYRRKAGHWLTLTQKWHVNILVIWNPRILPASLQALSPHLSLHRNIQHRSPECIYFVSPSPILCYSVFWPWSHTLSSPFYLHFPCVLHALGTSLTRLLLQLFTWT